MTSKEALEELYEFATNGTSFLSEESAKRCFKIIKEELDILESIKKDWNTNPNNKL